MQVILDGNRMVSREALHEYLREALNLPDYYGRNLDALYDVRTSYPEKLELMVVHADLMLENLGKYGNAFVKTLMDAAETTENLHLSICNEII